MKPISIRKTTSLHVLSVCALVLTSSFVFPKDYQTDPVPTHEPVVQTIVIDPGHGGKDPGCSGLNTREKDIALSISLKLGDLIQRHFPGSKVIYTRSTDVFIPLHERAQIANKADADLFISIHCNYVGKRNQAQGSETYVMGLHKAEDNLDVAKRENAAILMEDDYVQRYDGYDPDSPEGHIILSMYQNAHLEQSILFADYIEKQFSHGLARKSRGVKQAGFLVLRNTTMPSVLVEAGFLSHDADEAFLGDKANHLTMAQAIFNAFTDYKAHMEGSVPEDDLVTTNDPVSKPVSEKPVVASPNSTEPVAKSVDAAPKGDVISYYVQMAASKTQLSKATASWNVKAPVATKHENGYYKYLAGPFADFGQAEAVQKELRAGTCKDAFVVVYRGSERITMAEANASSGK